MKQMIRAALYWVNLKATGFRNAIPSRGSGELNASEFNDFEFNGEED